MWILALTACKHGDIEIVDTDPPVVEDPGEDVAFDIDRILPVSVTMDEGDFASLRVEARDALETLGGDCLAAPFESPFQWYGANADIDGQVVEDIGIRKKGFLGSLSEERPSLKLKLDKYVEGQRLGDTERVTLNNGHQDPSRIRSCLGYAYFEAAGVPAPRCNLAHVEVNGEDLGVYAHVEDVKTRFLERAFGDASGHLYEGTLSDLREGWTATFAPKTDTTDPTGAPLQPLVAALARPDDELLAALEPVLDIDAFLRFWAAEAVIAHWDGYAGNTNNFYVYVDPSDGRVRFVPWGADQVFYDLDGEPAPAVAVRGELARRLYGIPETRTAYAAELERQLDEAWDADSMLERIDALESLVAPHLLEPLEAAEDMDALREFVETREGALRTALSDGLPDLDDGPSEPLCLVPVGTLVWAFDTEFSAALDVPTLGGTFTAILDGTSWSNPPDALSVSGYGEDGEAVVTTIGWADGLVLQVAAGVDPDEWGPGTLPLDLVGGFAFFVIADEATEETLFQGFVGGQLSLIEAGLGEGDAVRGSVSGELYALTF
ncbi:MAG: CotH kinase family protein [Alphaproteobacteria bacterium]|nr:CotH kinase family protein [Alphaproteobacteria bacterium]